MLLSHWMKALAVLLWLAATAFVVSQCSRLLAPATPQPAASAKDVPPAPSKKPPPDELSDRARQRLKERKAHEEARAQRRKRHELLEAELVAMIKVDLPGALQELAEAAVRYRNKLHDLKHLKKAEQWARETPVKEAHARARGLTQEFYFSDLEAQKDRAGPTLHDPAHIDDLTKRIAAFKQGREDIDRFASDLPPFHGKVPEALILSAIDAIPFLVLPKDAFDPCRDPAACTKPATPEPPPPPEPPPAPRTVTSGHHYCVNAAAVRGQNLAIHARPDLLAPVVVYVRPTSCRLTATGRHANRRGSGELWVEVAHDYGYAGWANAVFLRPVR